jgi:arylsulfatase A-like enzyme
MVGQSLHGLATGQVEDWREDVLGEFHGHFFRYQQRMLRTDRYKLVVNGPDQNELYDLAEDPHELENRYRAPGYDEVVDRLTDRLYERLDGIGDDEFPRPGMRK